MGRDLPYPTTEGPYRVYANDKHAHELVWLHVEWRTVGGRRRRGPDGRFGLTPRRRVPQIVWVERVGSKIQWTPANFDPPWVTSKTWPGQPEVATHGSPP